MKIFDNTGDAEGCLGIVAVVVICWMLVVGLITTITWLVTHVRFV
jgi:hypothetical protein